VRSNGIGQFYFNAPYGQRTETEHLNNTDIKVKTTNG
jgi:hypothetical protein